MKGILLGLVEALMYLFDTEINPFLRHSRLRSDTGAAPEAN
jgi:hypothetical protein